MECKIVGIAPQKRPAAWVGIHQAGMGDPAPSLYNRQAGVMRERSASGPMYAISRSHGYCGLRAHCSLRQRQHIPDQQVSHGLSLSAQPGHGVCIATAPASALRAESFQSRHHESAQFLAVGLHDLDYLCVPQRLP